MEKQLRKRGGGGEKLRQYYGIGINANFSLSGKSFSSSSRIQFILSRQNGGSKQQPSTVNREATTGKVLYSLIVN